MYSIIWTAVIVIRITYMYLVCFSTPEVLRDKLSGTHLPSAKNTKLGPQQYHWTSG